MSDTSIIESVQRFYDVIARRSPELLFLNYGFAETIRPASDAVQGDLAMVCRRLYEAALTPFPTVERVLEVGCGRGGGAAFLLERHPSVSYLGLDLSKEHVRMCRLRFQSHAGATFAVADAALLPVPDARFDAAFSVEAVHHFEHAERFYGEVARALRPGGLFFIAGLWRPDHDASSPFERHGLRIEERCDITANVVASLAHTSGLRQQLIESLGLPERFTPLLMSWAGVRGYGAFEQLASGSLAYLRYRLVRT